MVADSEWIRLTPDTSQAILDDIVEQVLTEGFEQFADSLRESGAAEHEIARAIAYFTPIARRRSHEQLQLALRRLRH